jgi:hypothetical protein
MRPIVLTIVSTLAACGTEAGRVPFTAEAQSEATLPLAQGDVSFWTDIDISYQGPAVLQYRIELLQAGAVVATAVCDPLGAMSVKMGWVETNLDDAHSRRGGGKMGCSASVPAAGPTTVRATLAVASRPTTVALRKADLVRKQ